MDQHFLSSSFREKLIEHLFVAEMLKFSWIRAECSLEIAKPEVNNRGYDLIAERAGIVRHIQLKTSHIGARAATQKVHVALARKPSGCVTWIKFNEDSLALGPFLCFGGKAGQPLPDIDGLKPGKHTKANMLGVKGERKDIRVVPKSRFKSKATAAELFDWLFCADASG